MTQMKLPITKEQFEKLSSVVEDAGYETRGYSGRGMNGKKCLGVDCDRPLRMMTDILAEMVKQVNRPEDLSDLIRVISNASQDSMGLGAIVYWPDIPWMPSKSLSDELI